MWDAGQSTWVNQGLAITVANTGGGQPQDNMMPYVTVNCIIALFGTFPSRNQQEPFCTDEFLWRNFCAVARRSAISQCSYFSDSALFSLLGTTYRRGRTAFALPDMRGGALLQGWPKVLPSAGWVTRAAREITHRPADAPHNHGASVSPPQTPE